MASPKFFAGVDWSEHLNDLAVVDRSGEVVASTRFEATPTGARDALAVLSGLRSSHTFSRRSVPVAIEASRGLLVTALRRHGQTVIPIHPSTVARYRGRLNPGNRKKSDAGDAALLANILRTDSHAHRPLHTNSDDADAVGALTRAQLRATRTRQYHYLQLRSQLRAVHPAAVTAWAHLDGRLVRPEAREVITLAPTSGQAARLTRRQIRAALERSGRTRLLDSETDRLFALFREPVLRNHPAVEDALGQEVLTTLRFLGEACQSVAELTAAAGDLFTQHPQSHIYQSFPGVGLLTGARLLGELGDDPTRFATAKGLAAYAGARPFTWASGTSRTVLHRRVAANKRLAAYGHHWAFTSLTKSPQCRAHYDKRRAAGDRHNAALRRLFGKLLASLHHCLLHDELFDPEAAWPRPPDPA
ncbi:IS110 family transposase [Kitasatospora purpeofusca]|uniref:IS110 family transposase n=1 Tax=Kitasatospora purpeofusca TaxID=67352 RepID=UPI002A5A4854|nr:IS110 family transposase [Kitasatospora purpeofusca]MDY0816079.1 IS110 family transposase [Kitasatospora purpeofusca]